MKPDVKWWTGWYCKVLHAVDIKAPDDSYDVQAVCSVWVRPWMRINRPWQVKKIEAGIPKCKTCLRVLAAKS